MIRVPNGELRERLFCRLRGFDGIPTLLIESGELAPHGRFIIDDQNIWNEGGQRLRCRIPRRGWSLKIVRFESHDHFPECAGLRRDAVIRSA